MKKVREDCLNILDKTGSTKDFIFFSSHNLLCLGINPKIPESWVHVNK